jgi:hypothetical protein
MVSNAFVGKANPSDAQLGSAFNGIASSFMDGGQQQMRAAALAQAQREAVGRQQMGALVSSAFDPRVMAAAAANGVPLDQLATAARIRAATTAGVDSPLNAQLATATNNYGSTPLSQQRAEAATAAAAAAARAGAPVNYVGADGTLIHGTAGAAPAGAQPLVGTDDLKSALLSHVFLPTPGAPGAPSTPAATTTEDNSPDDTPDTPTPVSSAFSAPPAAIPASAPAAAPAADAGSWSPLPTLGSLFGSPAAAAPALSAPAAPTPAPLAKVAAPNVPALSDDQRTFVGLDKGDKALNYQVLGPNGRPSQVGRTTDGKTDMTTGQALPANATMTGVGTSGVTINTGDANTNTYGKDLVGGLATEHKTMMDGTEAAQTQLQGIHAMQGALAAIQAHGGTTGFGAQQLTDLKSAINTGANILGLDTQFNISDPEFLTKFNRQIAGAQAKAVGGARVTNFELQNYLAANPGLAMSPTGNQRLLGIQAQIAQRSVALGQALRGSVANAISQGGQPDAGANEQLIRAYDAAHPITDPITGQDLTKNLVIPGMQDVPAAAGGAPGSVRAYTPGVGFH